MPEKQIIQDIQNGNTAKFGLLVEKYQAMVFRTSMGFVHSKADAEDLTQDVFLKAFQSLNRFEGKSKFSTWLYRITVNYNLNYIAKQKRRQILSFVEDSLKGIFEQGSEEKNAQQQMEHIQTDEAVKHAIDSLPEKQRVAFVLSKYDDLSQKEIANIMQCSEGAIEQLLQRAKVNLQKKLSSFVGN